MTEHLVQIRDEHLVDGMRLAANNPCDPDLAKALLRKAADYIERLQAGMANDQQRLFHYERVFAESGAAKAAADDWFTIPPDHRTKERLAEHIGVVITDFNEAIDRLSEANKSLRGHLNLLNEMWLSAEKEIAENENNDHGGEPPRGDGTAGGT